MTRPHPFALIELEHEGHELKWKGTGTTWERNDEIETARYACSCGARITVETRTDVGPPTGKVPTP